MAKIQRYQQDRLASSLVGTPGIDPSGDVIANSIMQSAAAGAGSALALEQDAANRRADLTANVGSLAGAIGGGIVTGLAIKAAAEKQLRTAKGNALANDAAFEFSVEESKLRQQLRNEHGTDTTGMMDQYNKKVADLETATARKYRLIDDKGEVIDGAHSFYAQFNGKANTAKLEGTKWVEKYTWDQDTKLIMANTKVQAEQLSISMQNAETREEALKLYKDFLTPEMIVKYNTYMPGGTSDMQRDMRAAAKNYEMSQAAKHPSYFDDATGKFVDGEAVKAVKSGMWNDLFSADDNRDILAEDTRQRDKLLREQKEENDLGNQVNMFEGASAIVRATNWRADSDGLAAGKKEFADKLAAEEKKEKRFRSAEYTNYLVSGLKYMESLETAQAKETVAVNQYNENVDRAKAEEEWSNYRRSVQMEKDERDKLANTPDALTMRNGLDQSLDDMVQRVRLAGEGKGAKAGISLNDVSAIMAKLNEGFIKGSIDESNYNRIQKRAMALASSVTPKQLLPGTPKEALIYFPDQPPPKYLINAINPKMSVAEQQKLREELHRVEMGKLSSIPQNANNLTKQIMRKNAEIEVLQAHVKAISQGVPSPIHVNVPSKPTQTKRSVVKTQPFNIPAPPDGMPSLVPNAPGAQ